MNARKLLPWALAAYAIWWFYSNSRRIDIGNASVSRVKLESGGIRLNLKLPILNRGNISATVQGFLGQLFYGANALGTVTMVQPVQIERNSVSEPEFTALISYASLGMEVLSFLQARAGIPSAEPPAGTPPVRWEDFRIRGTLRVADVAIDINQTLFV